MSSWPYWFGTSAIAICGAQAAYVWRSTPEPYTQFTVGGSTMRHAIKHADFSLLVGLAVVWTAMWLIFLLLERRVRRTAGEDGVSGMRELIGYASLPIVMWASSLLLSPSDRLDLVYLAAAAVSIVTLLIFGATRRPASAPVPLGEAAGVGGLLTLLTTLSALVIPFGLNRLLLLAKAEPVWTGQPPPVVLAIAGAALGLIGTWWAWLDADRTRARFTSLLLAAQAPLPWAMLLVLPLPWRTSYGLSHGLPVGRAMIVVFLLIAVAYADLLRRMPSGSPSASPAPGAARPLAMLSPIVLAAVLLFLKQPSITIAPADIDDYHHGEWLVPVWSMVHDGAVPFWDYVPARGLVNYTRGAAAALLYGAPTDAAIGTTTGLLTLVLSALALAALSPLIGLLQAAALLIPIGIVNGVSEIDILDTVALALLLVAYARIRATPWLALWGVTSVCLFLWAPAQGSTIILGTAPLALWQVVRALRAEQVELRKTALIVVPALAVLLLVTPLGRMLLGAVRYGTEHGAVANAAHATEWTLSSHLPLPFNRWLFEAVRTAFIAVPLAGLALAGRALLTPALDEASRERRRQLLIIGVPIVIIGLLFIYRAGGRIDAGLTRLGFASLWMLGLLLPLLLLAAWGRERRAAIVAIGVAGGSLLGAAFAPFDLAAVASRGLDNAPRPPVTLVDGPGIGLPNVGVAAMEPAHVTNILAIQRVLNALLDPHETFLGLTERNALYFYLDRTIPIESGALYNLPNDVQMLRAIDQIERRRVPVVLAPDGVAGIHDGGPASLRTHVVYRYLIWRYTPVRIDGIIFLLKPDRLARLDAHPELKVETLDTLSLFVRAFPVHDLMGVPASWGDSWATLSAAATEVRTLPAPATMEQVEVIDAAAHRYRRTGAAAAVTWDFTASPMAGRQAGLLVMDFACTSGGAASNGATGPGGIPLDVAWAAPGAAAFDPADTLRLTASNGRLVVPLDAAPRWLLAPSIGRLQVRLADPAGCTEFALAGEGLWQRRLAAAVDPK